MSDMKIAETRPFPDKKPDVVFKIAMDRLQSQQRQIDALDGKISNLLGFGAVLIAIMAGFLALRDDPITFTQFALMCVSGGAFVTIVATSLCVYYTRPWESGPVLNETWQHAREHNEDTLSWCAAESFTKSYENNKNRVKWKIRAVNANLALITVQAVTLALGLGFIAIE